MLWLSVHSSTDVRNIGKDGFLVSFSHDLWGGDSVAFSVRGEKGGVRSVKLGIESLEELFKFVSTTE